MTSKFENQFNKNVKSDEDLFNCHQCGAYNQDDFEMFINDKWKKFSDEAWNDIWNGEGNPILRCKKCNHKFRIESTKVIGFDYFIEGENENI